MRRRCQHALATSHDGACTHTRWRWHWRCAPPVHPRRTQVPHRATCAQHQTPAIGRAAGQRRAQAQAGTPLGERHERRCRPGRCADTGRSRGHCGAHTRGSHQRCACRAQEHTKGRRADRCARRLGPGAEAESEEDGGGRCGRRKRKRRRGYHGAAFGRRACLQGRREWASHRRQQKGRHGRRNGRG